MSEKIWVVLGQGERDEGEWVVVSYRREADARVHADAATQRAVELNEWRCPNCTLPLANHHHRLGHCGEVPTNEYDPPMYAGDVHQGLVYSVVDTVLHDGPGPYPSPTVTQKDERDDKSAATSSCATCGCDLAATFVLGPERDPHHTWCALVRQLRADVDALEAEAAAR